MRKHKKRIRGLRQSDQDFAVFLKRMRVKVGVSGEMLGDGILDVSQISKIECGVRPTSKMLRNRLLGRLGVTPDMYENLLDIEDYAVWEQQQEILRAIDRRDFQKAQQLIRGYGGQALEEDSVGRQFCLMMKAEILKLQGADARELGSCYETAVHLTVPEVEQIYEKEKLLSVLEINTVLEYEFYRKENGASAEAFAVKCRYLMRYVEKSLYDELSKAKIYPKIVYYYLRELPSRDDRMALEDLQEALRVCDQAVEMLRDTGRAFYLVELLEYKRKLLGYIIKFLAEDGKEQEAERHQMALQESAELEDLLKKLYAEYGIPEYMQDCTYLYWQRWVFSIGDVLRIRRNMYGMTQQEVCDGICSAKSLGRAENKHTNMQREPLGKVLRRLGVSKEIQKTNIVTNDREVLQLRTELLACRNNRESAKARELLKQIKDRICLDIPENMQYVMEYEASLDLMEGKITGEEFVLREEKALQCTLDLKELCDMEEIYLTEMEMACIRQKMRYLDPAEKLKQIDFLIRFFDCLERRYELSDYIAMYEYVMVSVTSELGNMGEYRLATGLDKKVLKEVLRCRRLGTVDDFIYDMLWNENEQQTGDGQQTEKEKMTDGLRLCARISHFSKQTFCETFYLDKLSQSIAPSLSGLSLQGETDSSPA